MSGPTYAQQMQLIVSQYQEAEQPWPATSKQIAAWAVGKGLWRQHPSAVISQCAEELSRAMREEYIIDGQGRSVRAKHAARISGGSEQIVLWADIRTAPREHMELAFQQRRRQIVGDCRQLKVDVDSFNDNANIGQTIQLILDFTYDVAELEAMDELKAG